MNLFKEYRKKEKKNTSFDLLKKKVTIRDYSLINKYIDQGKINKEFLLILSSLSLEDLIALKLEATGRLLKGRMLTPKFFSSIKYIILEAILKYALSMSERKEDLELSFGIPYQALKRVLRKIEIDVVRGD